jgi:hypothetical protein
MRLAAVLLALARHLGAYIELGAEAACEVRNAWVRRIVLAWLAGVAFFAGSCALWLAGLMAVWETGWRMAYVLGTALLLLAFAVVAWIVATTRPAPGPATGTLKSELYKDAELFQQWKDTMLS